MYLFGGCIHSFDPYVQVDRHIAFLIDFQQAGSEVGNIIQFLGSCIVIQIYLVTCSLLTVVMFCQQTDLFRCAATFMLRVGVGEDSASACLGEFLQGFPGLLCTFIVINTVGISLS